jgi:hypothetical protein
MRQDFTSKNIYDYHFNEILEMKKKNLSILCFGLNFHRLDWFLKKFYDHDSHQSSFGLSSLEATKKAIPSRNYFSHLTEKDAYLEESLNNNYELQSKKFRLTQLNFFSAQQYL